jgi:hypothetical protein
VGLIAGGVVWKLTITNPNSPKRATFAITPTLPFFSSLEKGGGTFKDKKKY